MIDLVAYKPVMAEIAKAQGVDLGVGFSMFMANVKAREETYPSDTKVNYIALGMIFDSMTEEQKKQMYDEYFASK